MRIGALLSAISPNFGWLILSRFVVGVGIGGDYPVSAVIMSEYSNRKDRGKLAGLSWRLMFGLGAIPSMMVIYLRRKIPEFPRYTAQVLGDIEAATQAVKDFKGIS